MRFFKQILAGMLTGHHGKNSNNRSSHQSKRHHGQRDYSEFTPNNMTASLKSCPSCQHANPDQAKFCAQCGKSFNSGNCTACGHKLMPGNKFCGSCGQAI